MSTGLVVALAEGFRSCFLIGVKFFLGGQFDLFAVGFLLADRGIVNLRLEVFDRHVAVIYCLYDGDDHPSYPKQGAALQCSVSG